MEWGPDPSEYLRVTAGGGQIVDARAHPGDHGTFGANRLAARVMRPLGYLERHLNE
jgi:hypothetical protein